MTSVPRRLRRQPQRFSAQNTLALLPSPRLSLSDSASSACVAQDDRIVSFLISHARYPVLILTSSPSYSIAFLLLVAEMVTFCVLVLPLPYTFRRKLFHFLSESPAIAKLAYGIKIAFMFVLATAVFATSADRERTDQSLSFS